MWKLRIPGMGLRNWLAPAISSSGAAGFSGLVQKMTTWENMVCAALDCSRGLCESRTALQDGSENLSLLGIAVGTPVARRPYRDPGLCPCSTTGLRAGF